MIQPLIRKIGISATFVILALFYSMGALATNLNCSKAVKKLLLSTSSSYSHLNQVTSKVIGEISARPEINPSKILSPLSVNIRARRNDLVDFLYQRDLIEASSLTRLYLDKLIMAKVLEKYLGPAFDRFHPKTLGLKEFLSKHKLVDSFGAITADHSRIALAFEEEFPNGFILKPALAWNSGGKGFFTDQTAIVESLLRPDSEIYKSSEFLDPYRAIADNEEVITSGEKLIIQARIAGTVLSDSSHPAGTGEAMEYRVHSLYNKVVTGATRNRWGVEVHDEVLVKRIEDFVQDLLGRLPMKLTNRQAWSFDVFVTESGDMKLVEINTNRGLQTNWSGFLHYPWVVGAYVRHLELQYGWSFLGPSGWLLRNNLGNIKASLKRDFQYYIEESKTSENVRSEAIPELSALAQQSLDLLKRGKDQVLIPSSKEFSDTELLLTQFHSLMSVAKQVGDKGWQSFESWALSLD